MLFEGLSRKHASHFLEENNNESIVLYYAKYKQQISNTIYKDSYYGFRFWTLLMDHMRRVHTTLPLIMRSQYKGCDELYMYFKKCENRSSDIRGVMNDMLVCSEWCGALFEETCKFIIYPILKRYSVYSPTLVVFMFFDAISAMVDVYIEKGFDVKFRGFLKCYLNQNPMSFERCQCFSDVFRSMLADESVVFCKMRETHRRVKGT
jgi:hypothetical protein